MQRSCEIFRLTCLLAAVVSGMAACRAAQDGPRSADEQAIRTAAKAYVAAMQRGDAEALRAMWTEDGDYVDAAGRTFKARDLISQLTPADDDAGEPGDAALPESTLRFIAPDVALEDGASGYRVAEDGADVTGRFTALWVKREGMWLLASLRESESRSSPGHPELRSLDWLVGEWAAVGEDASLLTSWQWTDGGNFLLGEFLIYGQGREPVGGTQRIGWDPVAKQIKSWIFDSQGSRGEGRWRRDGDRWIVESTHVTADGKQAKTSATYSLGDSGKFILEVTSDWDAQEADADGGELPAQRFEFRRAASEE